MKIETGFFVVVCLFMFVLALFLLRKFSFLVHGSEQFFTIHMKGGQDHIRMWITSDWQQVKVTWGSDFC